MVFSFFSKIIHFQHYLAKKSSDHSTTLTNLRKLAKKQANIQKYLHL